MLNLNPELVDQDKIRKIRRKRMLKYAFLPCLLLLLGSAFVFRIGVFNVAYSVSYENKNFEIADSLTEAQGVGNIIMPYVRYYDGGVAKLRQRNIKDAESDFRSSLKENPPEKVLCNIYVNLSLSIELQADDKYNGGEYDEALVLYAKAQSTLYSNGCAEREEDAGTNEMAKNAKLRLDGKMAKTMNKINAVADEGGEDHPQPVSEKQLTDKQKDRLDERRESQNQVVWRVRANTGFSIGKNCDPSSGDICW